MIHPRHDQRAQVESLRILRWFALAGAIGIGCRALTFRPFGVLTQRGVLGWQNLQRSVGFTLANAPFGIRGRLGWGEKRSAVQQKRTP
jgi:hypothetical protein